MLSSIFVFTATEKLSPPEGALRSWTSASNMSGMLPSCDTLTAPDADPVLMVRVACLPSEEGLALARSMASQRPAPPDAGVRLIQSAETEEVQLPEELKVMVTLSPLAAIE